MRISINELLKKRLTNPGLVADDSVARTIRVVATSGDGNCWVEVENEDGEAFSNDLFNAAYENGVSQVDKARILACAAVLGHVQSMNDLGWCFRTGADPCQGDFWSAQPLAYAVRRGSLEKVRYLIELGNDPSRVDYDGSSVFFEASANPDVHVLELLLEHGADMDEGATDMTPMSRALVDSTPERVKWLADRGAYINDAVEQKAYCAPLANLRAILECGYNPNAFDEDSEDTKVIDHLDPRRQALFVEFGGTVLNRDAEKFYQTYKGGIRFYRRYGVVEFEGRWYSLCEDIWSDNAPTLCLYGMALGVRHDATMDEDGFYPCATLYFADSDGVHPVEVTEGPSETMWFNPVLCQFKDSMHGCVLEL